VVADIGVLKTFPAAPWRSRRLEFVNGMSANERFGCLSNWQRCGFDKITLEENPGTWITIVVNNRADRIARSRVFASIVVKDISYDRCVLIGNNLAGLVSYIKEAWEEWLATVSLHSTEEHPEAILLRMAQRFRIPYTQVLLKRQVDIMVPAGNGGADSDAILALTDRPDELAAYLAAADISECQAIIDYLQQNHALLASYQAFIGKIRQADGKVTDALEKHSMNCSGNGSHKNWSWWKITTPPAIKS